MSRHGYVDECDDSPEDQRRYAMWRGQVKSAFRGKRGQAFFKELAAALDAMPVKELITGELVNDDGECCAIGAVCKARGLDVSKVDYEEPEQVGGLVGIAKQMAAEIEWENDEGGWHETPEQRWQRMRRWVESRIKPTTETNSDTTST